MGLSGDDPKHVHGKDEARASGRESHGRARYSQHHEDDKIEAVVKNRDGFLDQAQTVEFTSLLAEKHAQSRLGHDDVDQCKKE